MSSTPPESFRHRWTTIKDRDGRDALLFVVKRTYAMDLFRGRCTPEGIEPQPEIHAEDVPAPGPDGRAGWLQEEGEMAPFKPKVDVIVHGVAYAPGGTAQPQWDVAVEVGSLRKQLRVCGPRRAFWQPPEKQTKKITIDRPPLFSDPEPITELPLTWDHAYGGTSALILPSQPKDEAAVGNDNEVDGNDGTAAADLARPPAAAPQEEEALPFSGTRAGNAQAIAQARAERGQALAAVQAGPAGDIRTAFHAARTEAIDLAEIQRSEEYQRKMKELADQRLVALESQLPIAVDHGGTTQPLDETVMAAVRAALATVADAPQDEQAVRRSYDDQGVPILEDGATVEAEDTWIAQSVARKQQEATAEAEAAALHAAAAASPPSPYPQISCPYNPAGKGFALGNRPETIEGLELPNIEHPQHPLVPSQVPRDPARLMEPDIVPAGFGWIAKDWWLRSRFGGVPPEQIEQVRQQIDEQILAMDPEDPAQRKVIENLLDYQPKALQPEFYNGAPPDQQLETLAGDEEVVLRNLDPSGVTHFRLPGHLPLLTLDRGKGPEPVSVRLDTLVIDRETLRVTLLWRGTLGYGGPEEMLDYPCFKVAVRETDMVQWTSEMERLRRTAAARHQGVTLELDRDEFLNALQVATQGQTPASAAVQGSAPAPGATSELAPVGWIAGVAPVVGGAKVANLADKGQERLIWDDDVPMKAQAEAAAAAAATTCAARKAALRQRIQELNAAAARP